MNLTQIHHYDIIGIIGVVILVVAFFLLQIKKIKIDELAYSLLNLIAAFLLLYSLMFSWNLASVIIEIFWIAISGIGIFRYYKYKT